MTPAAGELRVPQGWRRLGPVLPSGSSQHQVVVVSEAAGAVVAADITAVDQGVMGGLGVRHR
jgi:hypothetical protein